ncbi:MAG: threonylcarbamoyl-AMP synthase [Candidatus Makaraimicrobium thalassicum]|nr:MAG: threonylcarbamoyl-AMP synthase [Candidatus Omnitrophota bacterium]
MRPRVFQIDPYHIRPDLLKKAAEVIHNRGLVAFPTETVYGLGANALDPKAVAKIFEAKERPLDDPLIVHIAGEKDLFRLAAKVPRKLEKLVNRFWPGPLTVVLKKTELVPDIVTTGLDTVAIRMPSNMIARKFIAAADVPIAAPSANMFGRPSPTTARHVIDDLDKRIDIVLDGGSTEIGIESTVVEVIDGRVVVLRPGGIDVEQLRAIVGDVDMISESGDQHRFPGRYPRHYSPNAAVVLVKNNSWQVRNALSMISDMESRGYRVGVMARQEHADRYRGYNVKVLGPAANDRICASRLFQLLREFDAEKVDIIVAESIPEKELALAVMNRLRKAAGPSENYRTDISGSPHPGLFHHRKK